MFPVSFIICSLGQGLTSELFLEIYAHIFELPCLWTNTCRLKYEVINLHIKFFLIHFDL